ncbi:MAG: hypothetical protein Q9163_002591 [Psora crenata]
MDESTTYPVPPAAIVVPLLALITLVLDTPPFVWHIRNRNVAASSLVFWIILTNLMNFINALLWPTDDIAQWWPGQILCDIEVKLMTAVYIGVVGSLVCIMRNLARVLNTENTVLYPSKAQKRRRAAIDMLLCFGVPCYMMIAHYIVQPSRYYIFAIAGCTPPVDRSWPKLVLMFIWPPIFSLVVVYYSVLVIHRMRKYRKEFSSILVSSNSNLTKNRFLRLFLMSVALIVVFLPVQAYLLYQNSIVPMLPYSWDLVHGDDWGDIMLFPTGGVVAFDRWIQIAFGFAIFLFFGTGQDAKEMYREWLLAIGCGRIFPSLHRSSQGGGNLTSLFGSQTSSIGSRTRLLVQKLSRHSIVHLPSKTPPPSNSAGTPSPTSERKPFGQLSPISEQGDRFSASTVTFTAPQVSPSEPVRAHARSPWLKNFLVNTHLAAPNRRMGAGLGLYGVAIEPRLGTTSDSTRRDKAEKGDSLA